MAEAGRLGVSGWVRNRRDGSVEAMVSGAADALDRLLVACRRGPALARVERIDVEAAGTPAATVGFTQRPTE